MQAITDERHACGRVKKMKYVTFSYDDNSALNERLLTILDRYGAKCTFNLNSGMRVPGKVASFFLGSRRGISLEELVRMLKDTDHEIACHGEGHLDLTKLSHEKMVANVRNDKIALEKAFGREMTGFIYPFGGFSDETREVLKEAGFQYTRTVISTGRFDVPEDFLSWNPTCHHNDKKLFELAETFVSEQTQEDRIFYIWGHAWEYGVFKNWDRLEKLLDILKKDDTICYCTNGELVRRFGPACGN